jgi:hypothetical protein
VPCSQGGRRGNSDRESGGVWLKTHGGRSDQVGIAASLVTARHRAQAIWAHLMREAVRGDELRRELEQLPGRNAMEHTAHQAYHHGEAASAADPLARCLHFVPARSST